MNEIKKSERNTGSIESLKTRIADLFSKLREGQKETIKRACETVDVLLDFGATLAALKGRMGDSAFALFLDGAGIERAFAARAIKAAGQYGRVDYTEDMAAARQLWLYADLIPVAVGDHAVDVGRVSVPPVIQRLNWISEWVSRETEDVTTWEPQRRADLKDRLRPVVEFYSKL